MNITVKQLIKICNENKFIVVRYKNGDAGAINCKVATIPSRLKRAEANIDLETRFVSYYPCDLHEYISLKQPFV